MTHFLLSYTFEPSRRGRDTLCEPAYVRYLDEAKTRGHLLLAGMVKDDREEAMLLFNVADAWVVEEFVANDPLVKEGVVEDWTIRKWIPEVGYLA